MAEYKYKFKLEEPTQAESAVKGGRGIASRPVDKPQEKDYLSSFYDIISGYVGDDAEKVLSPKKKDFDIDSFYAEFDELTLRSSEEAALQRMEAGTTQSLVEGGSEAFRTKLPEGESLVPELRPDSKGLMAKPVADGVQPSDGKDFIDTALDEVLVSEGGFQNDKEDTGNYVDGKLIGTNRGITPAALAEYRGVEPSSITVDDIKDITEKEARDIYRKNYYEKPKIDQLPEELQANVFDMNINAGANSIKILQRLAGVKADGVIGPKTLKAVKEAGITNEQYTEARIQYYKDLAESKPNLKKYLKGWINRANKYRG